jgi:hypothetical protein
MITELKPLLGYIWDHFPSGSLNIATNLEKTVVNDYNKFSAVHKTKSIIIYSPPTVETRKTALAHVYQPSFLCLSEGIIHNGTW